MADMLAESTQARKKSMTLGSVAYAGELSAQLLDHAECLEKNYKQLQTALANNVEDRTFYQKVFRAVDRKSAWYSSAEAGGQKNECKQSCLCATVLTWACLQTRGPAMNRSLLVPYSS